MRQSEDAASVSPALPESVFLEEREEGLPGTDRSRCFRPDWHLNCSRSLAKLPPFHRESFQSAVSLETAVPALIVCEISLNAGFLSTVPGDAQPQLVR